MTVTLDLDPAVEARLIEQAAAHGTSIEEFIKSVLESNLGGGTKEPFESPGSPEEWESVLDEFANSSYFAKAANQFVDGGRERVSIAEGRR